VDTKEPIALDYGAPERETRRGCWGRVFFYILAPIAILIGTIWSYAALLTCEWYQRNGYQVRQGYVVFDEICLAFCVAAGGAWVVVVGIRIFRKILRA